MQNNPTLRDVAAQAGVSVATASRVLNRVPGCSERVRKQVRDAQASLGYEPDPGVAALARRRRGSGRNRYPVALLLEYEKALDGYQRPLTEALREELETRGYHLTLEIIPAHGGPASASRILINRGVVGCVLYSLNQPEVVRDFEWRRFSVLAFHQENFVLPFDTVRPDLFSAMFDAWQRARAFGSRRIGVVIPSSIIARENELLLSACAYHMRELPESPPPLILQPDAAGGMAHYEKQTLNWYHMHRPEVVIGKTDGAYWALHQGGISCPGDFRFISLHLSDPPGRLSGYHWPARKLAEAMAERLHSLISLGARGPRDCPGIWSLPCTWQEGGTF